MLQNRVDPSANIIKTIARGNWMGNRGQLHDKGKTILRPFKLKAWLICLLEFKQRKRQVMAPNLYTELFFLDEATAFAAGHRPCFECRRQDYNHFKAAWLAGNPEYNFPSTVSINQIDEVIHRERIDHTGNKVTYRENLKNLPDGAFILIADEPCLVFGDKIYHWSPSGYGNPQELPETDTVEVLTPKSTVNAFRSGYHPQLAL